MSRKLGDENNEKYGLNVTLDLGIHLEPAKYDEMKIDGGDG